MYVQFDAVISGLKEETKKTKEMEDITVDEEGHLKLSSDQVMHNL